MTFTALPAFLNIDIILASQSPRRQTLLRNMGLCFSTINIQVEEVYPSTLPAKEVASYLSILKAKNYSKTLSANQLLITADTTVVQGEQILGKPNNKTEAAAMLNKLSGKSHQVITGVSLRSIKGLFSFSECTEVSFHHLSRKDIEYYINNFQPLDKAGAYGIQEWIGMIGVCTLQGSFYNVMGFPTAAFYQYINANVAQMF